MKTHKKRFNQQDVIKAINKANREISFERNGGGHFVAKTRPHKNKKAYDRKNGKRELKNLLPFYLYYISILALCLISPITEFKNVYQLPSPFTLAYSLA